MNAAIDWISSAIGEGTFGPLHLLLIGVLLAGWAVFWIATWKALDTFGVILAIIILGALVWLMYDIGLLESHSASSITWIVLITLSLVLAIGLLTCVVVIGRQHPSLCKIAHAFWKCIGARECFNNRHVLYIAQGLQVVLAFCHRELGRPTA